MSEAHATPMPFVSVIVPVKDDAEALTACLEGLARQTYPQDRFEVLVVDNGSCTSPQTRCDAHANVVLLHEPRPGSYAARNRALAIARGEILAFTDADCVPEPTWLRHGAAHFRARPHAGFVGGRVELFALDPRRPTPAEIFDRLVAFPQEHTVLRRRRSVTANLFTRRAIVDAVGPFEGSLRSGGDMEFTRRVSDAGYEAVYGHDVVVHHPARRSVAALMRKERRVARGRYALVTRFPRQGIDERGVPDLLRRYSSHLWTESRSILATQRPHRRHHAWVAVGVNAMVRMAGLFEVLRMVSRDVGDALRRKHRFDWRNT